MTAHNVLKHNQTVSLTDFPPTRDVSSRGKAQTN